jgi:hydrogenase maturation factor
MTTLTVEFTGIPEEVLETLVKEGYAKTKAEALRYSLIHIGEELDIIKKRFHVRAEEYAYRESKRGK